MNGLVPGCSIRKRLPDPLRHVLDLDDRQFLVWFYEVRDDSNGIFSGLDCPGIRSL